MTSGVRSGRGGERSLVLLIFHRMDLLLNKRQPNGSCLTRPSAGRKSHCLWLMFSLSLSLPLPPFSLSFSLSTCLSLPPAQGDWLDQQVAVLLFICGLYQCNTNHLTIITEHTMTITSDLYLKHKPSHHYQSAHYYYKIRATSETP